MNFIVGVDIGTAGCRACVYDLDGTYKSEASKEYSLLTPQPSWIEQDPDEIFESFVNVIASVIEKSKISHVNNLTIVLGSVFNSLILVDRNYNALYPMLTWADLRSTKYSNYLKQYYDAIDIYKRTGCPVHPKYSPAKILWFKNEMPNLFYKTSKFISIKEFILYRLLNKFIIDKSIASGSGLFNIHNSIWDKRILEILGININQLSEVVPTTHIENQIDIKIRKRLNVGTNINIVVGAGDGVLSVIGAGAVDKGDAIVTIGTSGAMRVLTKIPKLDRKARTWCYNLTDDYWVAGGVINNGGIILKWFRDNFAPCDWYISKKIGVNIYDLLIDYARDIPIGSNGLIMLPFLVGEASPNWDTNSKGVLFGLNFNHRKEDIVRAILEGIIFRMYSVYNALRDVTGDIEKIRVSGSFTKSKIWLQILADIFGKTVLAPKISEVAVFGAAILGRHALGEIKDIKEAHKNIKITEKYYPNSINHKKYKRLYNIYKRVYKNLQKEFKEISEIQRSFS